MKNLALLLAFITIGFYGFTQDVIMKKDGGKIEAKIIEISHTTIKFKRFDQQDGPLRTIPKSQVREIVYEDGSWDNFEDEPIEEEKTESTSTSRPEPMRNDKDPLFDNGINIDLLLGSGSNNYLARESQFCQACIYDPNTGLYSDTTYVSDTQRNNSYFSIGFRLGTKFYLHGSAKWKIGIQANWIRFGIHIDPSDPLYSMVAGPKTIAPLNAGVANIFKFSDKVGLELNLTGGFNMDLDLDYGGMTYGAAVTPEVKFRYNNLAIGLDYSRVFGISDSRDNNNPYVERELVKDHWNMISLSVGAKF